MSWTKTKAGGFTKYTQSLDGGEEDTICLAGAGCLVESGGDEVIVSTASNAGGLDDSYTYEALDTTDANEVLSVPAGAHMLKVKDGGGTSTVNVYVTGVATGQDTVTIGGIGQDPS